MLIALTTQRVVQMSASGESSLREILSKETIEETASEEAFQREILPEEVIQPESSFSERLGQSSHTEEELFRARRRCATNWSIVFTIAILLTILLGLLSPALTTPDTTPQNLCNATCKTCILGSPNYCSACEVGYYLQPNGRQCNTQCPSGYIRDNTTWTCRESTPD